jgi:serine/threonine protein kinase
MTAQSVTCPPESVLNDFGLGKLDAASTNWVSQHIAKCPDCRHRLAGLSGRTFAGGPPRAEGAAQPGRRERTYVPGESLANGSSSTAGSWGGVRPEATPPAGQAASGNVAAPAELANHPDYELIKELGQGGMGTVYLAKNRLMDRLEVLKVISKSLLDRPGALERFQQEIRSAAKLAHSNIVAAYSVLRPGELLVFAMEYVRGQDLSQVVKQRGPLPVTNAAFYIHQVANGLQHAFEKGMVHRDIKPNNLMLAIEGKRHVVKILDFGLAKASSEKGAESGLTKSGQMLGTPDYVAPEQTLDAQKADVRADIYSLGCTLYFLLSGGPPFQEASLFEILQAHHTRDPKPLNPVRPEVPVQLDAVVAKMMAKKPADRYQTPVEVARALVPFFKAGEALPPLAEGKRSQSGDTASGTGEPTLLPPAAAPSMPFSPQPLAGSSVTPIPLAPAPPARLPAAAPVAVVTADSASPRSTRKRRRGIGPVVAVGLAFVALGLTAATFMTFQKPKQPSVAARTERPKKRPPVEPEPVPTTPPASHHEVASLNIMPAVQPLQEAQRGTEQPAVEKVDDASPAAVNVPIAEPRTLAPLVESQKQAETPSLETESMESDEDAETPENPHPTKGAKSSARKRGQRGPEPGTTQFLSELRLQAYFVFVPPKVVIPG